MKKRFFLTLLVILLLIPVTVAQSGNFPTVIPLPLGFQPEGVVAGRGTDLYAGSLADGSIYKVDAKTGAGDLLVPAQSGRIAVGLAYDQRSNLLFVAGGPSGQAYVYDASTGASVASYQLDSSGTTFINDVIVTRSAAYFTDSFNPTLYKLPLSLPSSAEALTLTGDYSQVSGFNVNGIVATPNGKSLIIVQSSTGYLYQVDPESGNATVIDLGGPTVNSGDGLLLEGRTLYVVQNTLNQIAVVELAPDLSSGAIVHTITNDNFDVPTTVASIGNALYAVNARFGTTPGPSVEYDIVRVTK